jgi:dipeptidyl aminopeptidase/acylaminoacyl peptidase
MLGASALLLATSAAAGQNSTTTPEAPTARPAAASPAGPIPVELFAQLPFIDSPILSPDGTRIAAKIAIHGEQRLASIPIGDSKHLTMINLGDLDLNDWFWVNNDWMVARIGTRAPVEGDSWYLRRAVALSADGTKSFVLGKDIAAQGADDVLWVAHDGSPHILLALQTSIYSNEPGFSPEIRDFDVSTGKSTRIVSSTSNVFDWYADGNGNVRLGISYDDDTRSSKLLYREKQGQSFRTVSKARGKNASLGTIPKLFLDGGKGVAFDDNDGFNGLYTYDFSTFKTGEKLFGVPGYDLGTVISDDAQARVIGVRYTDTRPRTHWFDPKLAAFQEEIDKSVGTRQAHITSWNRDFSVLIVYVGGADQPGAYYTYRPVEGVMHLLARVNEGLGPSALSPVKTIRYKARDGLEIPAVLTLPQGKPAKDLPLVLMPHGGPYVRDDESWDWWAQFMASRGYAVLQPNYRGSTGFGKDYTDKGDGQWGLGMQDDLVDAVKWAAGEGLVDPKRVCIAGASYGGYAALRAAQRDHGIYRCAISYAGVADLPAMLRYDAGFFNGGATKDYWRAQAPDLKSVSPINFPGDFSIPVLIMHGKADLRVPVKQSREMAEKLKAAGKTYRYVEQPKGDHHFTKEADRLQFLKELEAFLKQYNPA